MRWTKLCLAMIILMTMTLLGCTDLPYIYNDPLDANDSLNIYNEDANTLIFFTTRPLDIVCTKHGRLERLDKYVFEDSDKSYCRKCVLDVALIYLDKHID